MLLGRRLMPILLAFVYCIWSEQASYSRVDGSVRFDLIWFNNLGIYQMNAFESEINMG
jgi:hypothetical protein